MGRHGSRVRGEDMKQGQAGFGTVAPHHVGPMAQRQSMGWLAVAVALSILAILIMGVMAEDRWCGPELCVEEAVRF